MKKSCTVDTVNAVAKMKKPCTVDTVVSAMKNACKNVSYSNNSHITLELNSHIGSELDSESEAHTDHDLTLEDEQDRISYIKILDYTQKMMRKFLNMRSSIKISNSVDLKQCISRDLDELNQDQIINKMKFHLKIQSPVNQRDATDGFCRRAKYGHFGPDKDEHFGSDKDEHFGPDRDEFYMPGK
jgi:hypothetical protein